MYFYVVVMSLYQRYSDPNDPVHPEYEKIQRRRMRKKRQQEAKQEKVNLEQTLGQENQGFQGPEVNLQIVTDDEGED